MKFDSSATGLWTSPDKALPEVGEVCLVKTGNYVGTYEFVGTIGTIKGNGLYFRCLASVVHVDNVEAWAKIFGYGDKLIPY